MIKDPRYSQAPIEELKKGLLRTLLYFDIFSFPLRLEEAHRYCGVRAERQTVEEALLAMVREGQAWNCREYYLARRRLDWVRQRERNYAISCKKMKAATRNAHFIGQFPFVRAVSISGSLSKFSADEQADIDYFIIVHSRRLWICRTFLHLFKKLTFLFGRQHDFCMNYFLDEDELELKDRNLYIALESITAIPMYGRNTHQAFYQANTWVQCYFPNCDPTIRLRQPMAEGNGPVKRILEAAFAGQWGNWINTALRRVTVQWWRKKFQQKGFPMQFFDKDLRATEGESKYHPNDYQRTILEAYQQRIRAYEEQYGGTL